MRIIDGKREPTVTDRGIYGFFGAYRFLSNFQILSAPIIYEGREFMTSEAAYMSGKTDDRRNKDWLSVNSARPGECKAFSKTPEFNPNEIASHRDFVRRAIVMADVLELKFAQPDMRMLLLETGTKELVETNNWGDETWGKAVDPEGFPGNGNNYLGKLLMSLREEIREAHPTLTF